MFKLHTGDSYFGKKIYIFSQLVFILISTEISGRRNIFLVRRKEAEIYQYCNCSQQRINDHSWAARGLF